MSGRTARVHRYVPVRLTASMRFQSASSVLHEGRAASLARIINEDLDGPELRPRLARSLGQWQRCRTHPRQS